MTGRVFIDDDAVGAKGHGRDAGGIDGATNFRLASQAQQITSAVDVGAVHGIGITDPEPVICGHVDDSVAALKSRSEGFRSGEITNHRISGNAFNVGKIAGFADKEAEVSAFSGEGSRHMMANEAGSACKEYPHSNVLGTSSYLKCCVWRERYSRNFPMSHTWPNGSLTDPCNILLIGRGPVVECSCSTTGLRAMAPAAKAFR